ncbi:MAG: FtsX-like permease family protein [Planctomycetota bacterium]|nr:FtsX-like permease family protein [Planctomycetota bacterium]
MYKLLLIFKYLRRKLAPLFAALAVTLCTAMVIIVISVMGGFLEMMKGAAKRLTGDVIIRADLTGFPDYKPMIEGLRKLPDVEAATPLLRSFALAKMAERVSPVEVLGIEPAGLEAVTGFRDTLHWSAKDVLDDLQSRMPPMDTLSAAQKARYEAAVKRIGEADFREYAMKLKPPSHWGDLPGAVPGIAVPPGARRDSKGNYSFNNSSVSTKITLTLMPLTRRGDVRGEPEYADFFVVNEFKSGLYDIDANRVYVPLEVLQAKLHMEAHAERDPETDKPTGKTISGRVTEVMIRAKPGADLHAVRESVEKYVQEFLMQRHEFPLIAVETWQERHGTFLGAVEKEKGLLTVLFGIVSIVAVAMIAVIFYMIVLEKTRDIGVLRALGASRAGIMSIFLGYGLAIGIVGAAMGLGLAASIVWNINEIQDKLFEWFGFKMWDPSIYYFDKIPSRLDHTEVTVIAILAVVSSVVGSAIPAFLAGRLDPVEALRYE